MSFLLALISQNKTRIEKSQVESLEDLEFADDIALLSHHLNHMQEKTQCLEATVAQWD